MSLFAKLKQFFPLIFACLMFAALLVAQMSMHGSSTAANQLELPAEKAQVYESEFSKLKGQTTRGSDINFSEAAQPIIILNFWASWCRPCLSEFETLKKFINKFGSEQVLVVGINNDSDDPKKAVRKVEKDLALNFESIIDMDGKIAQSFFINEIPASIVFHKGKVIHFENKEFDFMGKSFLSLIQNKLNQD